MQTYFKINSFHVEWIMRFILISNQIFKSEICMFTASWTKCQTGYDQKVLASTEKIRKCENENYLFNKRALSK